VNENAMKWSRPYPAAHNLSSSFAHQFASEATTMRVIRELAGDDMFCEPTNIVVALVTW